MTALISVDQFRRDLKAERTPEGAVWRVSTEPPAPVEGVDRVLRFVFSDNSVDRMGDRIMANGWVLDDFLRNPVALWAHDSSQPSIGRASNLIVEGNRLLGDIEFADAETYAFADTVYRLLKGRFLNAVSVGFIPVEHQFSNDDARPHGIDFLRQTLLEISVCPIPANPNALSAARAKGIDTRPLVQWAERTLEGSEQIILSKAELQRLRLAAKENSMAKAAPARRGQTHRADSAPFGQRAAGADETDPTAGGAVAGTCGRSADEACGMTDLAECSIHCAETNLGGLDDKALRALARRLRALGPADDETPDNEVPVAHEDAIRLAHKALRTSKAFMAEGMTHHAKAVDLLEGVVRALDDGNGDDDGGTAAPPESQSGTDPNSNEQKRRDLARAKELASKHQF